jgi:hypothetical protein
VPGAGIVHCEYGEKSADHQRRLNFDEGYCSGNEVNQGWAGSDSDSESEDDAGMEEWPGFDELLDSKIGMI